MRSWKLIAGVALALGGAVSGGAVSAPADEAAEETPPQTYARSCAACHGADLRGGRAGSLVDDVWLYGGDRESVVASIRDGRVDAGMPAYRHSLSEAQLAGLADFVLARAQAERERR